jgi:hypothetical protein
MQPARILPGLRPLLDRMAAALSPVIRESVTPIAVIRGELTRQWGTGTFFRVADESFLVTACHVWDEATRCGFDHELFVFDLDGRVDEHVGLRPVPLSGTLHRVKDPLDVAILQLDAKVVDLLKEVRFLRLDEVTVRPRQRGLCWVFGFPLERAEDCPTRSLFLFNPFFLATPFHRGRVSHLENYDPKVHFLLDAAHDNLCFPDGMPADMPNRLNGISGCSIWQPEWPEGNAVEKWDPSRTRIVGVHTSHYPKSSIIKATSWGAVAAALYQCRPDLRPVIQFHLGPP